MVAEIAIGRKTKLSAIGAFNSLDKRFSFVGIIASVIPIIILPYYSIIGGWVMKYFAGFAMGQASVMAGEGYFNNYVSPVCLVAILVSSVLNALGIIKI